MAKGGVLVTGGAGYIGSHTVQKLVGYGERVVVLDNLVKGFRQAVTGATLVSATSATMRWSRGFSLIMASTPSCISPHTRCNL